MISIITYNPFPPYPTSGIHRINNKRALILPETFSENKNKGPQFVTLHDPNWKKVIHYQNSLDKVNIFAGKKESGALEIIQLAMLTFSNELEKLYFIFCNHEEKEKVDLVHQLGGNESNYFIFKDHHPQCREEIVLLGLLYAYTGIP